MVAERTGPLSAVKLSGSIPPLAESFHQRPETGLDLRAGLYPGDTVVLTHRGRPGERREHMSSVQVDGVSPAVLAAGGAYQGTHARQSVLWKPEAHPVPFRRGLSLEADGLAEAAITHWQDMLVTSTRLLGNGHANAVTARDRLAAAYESAGRFGEAIAVFSTALADRERNQGPEHPDTLTARGNLAHAYSSAGRPAEAVALYEQVAASAGRHLGAGHPVTLAARAKLAGAYQTAARGKEALTAYQMLLADAERLLGARHQDTLATRENLAAAAGG